jgi:glycerate 2-kinase
MFRNETELLSGENRRTRAKVLGMLEAGIRSVDPRASILESLSFKGDVLRVGPHGSMEQRGGDAQKIRLEKGSRVLVVGCGKAATAMVEAVHEVLGDRAEGSVNGLEDRTIGKIRIVKARHPIPDESGVRGAERILEIAKGATEKDVVLCLISGGGSALMPLPEEGITLADKMATTRLLLKCGADIVEINSVRKHLSRIKGGKLALAAGKARVFSLILSDVLGDPLDSIASGPTAPDTKTYDDAIGVFHKYRIWDEAPANVRKVLESRRNETPKADHPVFSRVTNLLIGNNEKAVDAAAAKARELGYHVATRYRWMVGEARDFPSKVLFPEMSKLLATGELKGPCALVFGGELTVTLKGKGRGGRNQEMALAALPALEVGWTLATVGTDGIDGNSDAAGAIADAEVLMKVAEQKLDVAGFLQNNDSNCLLAKANGLLITGPTGTNVADIAVLLVE